MVSTSFRSQTTSRVNRLGCRLGNLVLEARIRLRTAGKGHPLAPILQAQSDRRSRRSILLTIMALALTSRQVPGFAQPTPLPVCTDPARPGVGCACATGTQDPCGHTTLLCCPSRAQPPPGAAGVCVPASVGCNPLGPPLATPQATPA